MGKYIIYTYQFKPIKRGGFFKDLDPLIMDKKQDILDDILKSDISFRRSNKIYYHKFVVKESGVYILKLANNKYIGVEENFMKNKIPTNPSSLIIIDNRQDVQKIFIQDTESFKDTNMVASILEKTFIRYLDDKNLTITINREYQSSEFWDIISRYPKGIEMVRFNFVYPNLPRTREIISNIIGDASKQTNSESTKLEFKAAPQELLELLPENENLQGLVGGASQSGCEVVIKAKGIKSFVRTGNTVQSLEIEELETKIEPSLFSNSRIEKIIEILNSVKP